jgi:anti-sigma-K factor RskA
VSRRCASYTTSSKLRHNTTLRAAALIWQGRLASVAELQPQVAPSPLVWLRIENLVKADKQAQAMQAARLTDRPAGGCGSAWACGAARRVRRL